MSVINGAPRITLSDPSLVESRLVELLLIGFAVLGGQFGDSLAARTEQVE